MLEPTPCWCGVLCPSTAAATTTITTSLSAIRQYGNADAKNKALQAAGAYVPRSFADMGPLLKALYTKLVKEGTIVPEPEG